MENDATRPSLYHSFLIRMWREEDLDDPERASEWQGEVEHIQSGRRWKFENLHDLLGFIQIQAQNPGGIATTGNE